MYNVHGGFNLLMTMMMTMMMIGGDDDDESDDWDNDDVPLRFVRVASRPHDQLALPVIVFVVIFPHILQQHQRDRMFAAHLTSLYCAEVLDRKRGELLRRLVSEILHHHS